MADWKAMYEALKSYEPKALWTGAYRDEEGNCCAVGALGEAEFASRRTTP